MNKEKMQNKELDQVSGGMQDDDPFLCGCPSCHDEYSTRTQYPNGFYVSSDSHGCSSIFHYKCPNCGHEWTN